MRCDRTALSSPGRTTLLRRRTERRFSSVKITLRDGRPSREPNEPDILQLMKFAPEYVTCVLNENFEDAKSLLLSPLMAINYAHLVMLAAQGIVSPKDARAIRVALDGVSQDEIRAVIYDGTYEDLFFYVERLVTNACGDDVAGRLHTARSRNDIDMTMYRMRQRELVLGLMAATF